MKQLRPAERRFAPLFVATVTLLAACGGSAADPDIQPENDSVSVVSSTAEPATNETATDSNVDEIDEPDPTLPAETIDVGLQGVVQAVPCDENEACAEEISLNGLTYTVSCTYIDPAAVDLGTLLGSGRVLGRDIVAHALADDPSFASIAITAGPENACVENPDPATPTSDWQLVWSGPLDMDLMCSIGLFGPADPTLGICNQE